MNPFSHGCHTLNIDPSPRKIKTLEYQYSNHRGQGNLFQNKTVKPLKPYRIITFSLINLRRNFSFYATPPPYVSTGPHA